MWEESSSLALVGRLVALELVSVDGDGSSSELSGLVAGASSSISAAGADLTDVLRLQHGVANGVEAADELVTSSLEASAPLCTRPELSLSSPGG
jgi:hypothetical protein